MAPRPATDDPSGGFDLRVTCAPGLGPWLAREIADLGLEAAATHHTGVEIAGATDADVMRLNLHLRTALHVLRPLASFRCTGPEELYWRVSKLRWEHLIPDDGFVSVTSKVETRAVDNTMFASLRVKDAIVDRIAKQRGRRPDSGSRRDRAVVHLYWSGSQAVVSLNTSGEKLADRGYRRRPHTAPMQETLAAAVLMAAGYDGTAPLVLPMCGSGTLAIEAALLARRRPPGLLRANYAFMHLLGFDDDAWQAQRREARGRGRKRPTPAPIIATDHDPDAVEAARANARTAGVDQLITFDTCDFADTAVPDAAAGGIVLMNPPYGLRLGETEALVPLYGRIGDFLKQRCAGYTGYVFTGNGDLARKVGLRTKRRIPFWNADVECRLLAYELYAGAGQADGARAGDRCRG